MDVWVAISFVEAGVLLKVILRTLLIGEVAKISFVFEYKTISSFSKVSLPIFASALDFSVASRCVINRLVSANAVKAETTNNSSEIEIFFMVFLLINFQVFMAKTTTLLYISRH